MSDEPPRDAGGSQEEPKPQDADPGGAAADPLARHLRPLVDPTRLDLGLSRTVRMLTEAQGEMARNVSRFAATNGVFEAVERARAGWLATVESPFLRMAEALARVSTGPSLVAATLAAQVADARLASLAMITSPAFKALHENQFSQLSQIARFVERQNVTLAAIRPALEISRPVVFATQAWRSVVDAARPDFEVDLARLRMTARGTGGAVEAGILLSERDNSKLVELQAEARASIGPAQASVELRVRLDEIHPDLGNHLDGAWERIQGGGADAAGQAANSLMEVIDWTLRLLAPDDDVLAWHAAEKRPTNDLHNGKPTRSLRVRYAVRNHPEKRRAVGLYVKSIGELVSVIQSPKHSVETRAGEALAHVALVVEGLLHYLLVD